MYKSFGSHPQAYARGLPADEVKMALERNLRTLNIFYEISFVLYIYLTGKEQLTRISKMNLS
jgi:hypothetical protein